MSTGDNTQSTPRETLLIESHRSGKALPYNGFAMIIAFPASKRTAPTSPGDQRGGVPKNEAGRFPLLCTWFRVPETRFSGATSKNPVSFSVVKPIPIPFSRTYRVARILPNHPYTCFLKNLDPFSYSLIVHFLPALLLRQYL